MSLESDKIMQNKIFGMKEYDRFFLKIVLVGGRTWALFGFGLFDLRYKTWDHSTTALPLLRVYDLLKMLIVKIQYEFALMTNIVTVKCMLS